MSPTLPPSFLNQMRSQLQEEAEAFIRSYDQPRTYGLRLHTHKLAANSPRLLSGLIEEFDLTPVPWCGTGYYYPETAKPGKHPLHAAGAYYIQEPSAMSAVELLDPQPGDVVLDLAAAPGGKSTQIADKLQGQGLLITNEIHPARAKILSENIERMGIANAVVVSAAPQQLAERFPRFFDKLMVDAPCSGEGMFRKDPDAISEWSPAHVEMCAARQLDILQSAVAMLKPGGRLAYSTCTFNEQENEQTVAALLAGFPALRLLRTERIWPHLEQGEGHFVALLELQNELDDREAGKQAEPRSSAAPARSKRGAKPEEEGMLLFAQLADNIGGPGYAAELQEELGKGSPLLFGDQLYWLPAGPGSGFSPELLQGLKVLRPGLHLAELKKDRAEPAHALALALTGPIFSRARQLQLTASQAERYLRGEALEAADAAAGWTLAVYEGLPLGWGKASGGQLKNHYPKGLRRA
ncbi:16S rRNA C967 or C1407 C5-methylase, RsmB/RsmF family [Paenibacillus sp. UNCCL117]|uniref:RsmF rRNA methyltransferase first C-terminal domain-containing protein n=1 Tax=unclassified Paenibacillus TaxID=185978 RepID=UPI000889A2EE|nr:MULTISPECIES: RsmF rRNA methyltransferase first C-terminal domain-containing protein [unclassified Paenibacillus]SDC23719.1 16S rRNA C967 or C1407 C5-methylase, RsmB/RsmF family [Paenibacillus sp. cl123]SFW19365.1 16S rRNA C967 or C1407 C5-methylase, RsmB/RsmF family [Paenibacillus sp. UNCCL117]